MPKPRALSAAQELEAFTVWKATPGRGTVAALARSYGLTWVGMRGLLARVEHEQQFKDSRESLNSEIERILGGSTHDSYEKA
jgi:hypothetical protein